MLRHWLAAGLLFMTITASARGTASLVFWNAQQASDAVQAICREFTRETGIPIDVSWISQSEYRTTLLRHAHDGELPDVALVPGDFLSMRSELQLSALPSALQSSAILPGALAAGRLEGQAYGAPVVWGNHLMLAYNRDFVSQPARNFAELEQQHQQLRQRGVRTLALNFGEMYSLVPFLTAFGGWPLDDKGMIRLDGEPMHNALDFYFSLAERGVILRECRSNCVPERFARGEFAYAIAGDWDLRSLAQQMGSRLGIARLPNIGKTAPVSMFSANVLVFPGRSLQGQKGEQLRRFLTWMQSPATQRRWAKEARLFPVHRQVFRETIRKADGNLAASLEQLRASRVMPNDRNMSFAWEGMAKGFSAMYNGRVDAAGAAALMQQHAERLARRAGD